MAGDTINSPQDIILLSLKGATITAAGQDPDPEDISDAFMLMNMMVSQWARKRWLVWHLTVTDFVATGAQSYTVGPGGNFNIARPDRLEAAYFTQNTGTTPVDYPLRLIQSREEYSRIALKTLAGAFPTHIFYDAAYPVGTVYPWPLPNAGYTIHIVTKDPLVKFTSLTQALNMPDEVIGALHYNLICRLRPAYGLPPDESMVALAKDSLAVIRRANFQIGQLAMPRSLVASGNYNVYSDNNA